jgi:hypothetical protein
MNVRRAAIGAGLAGLGLAAGLGWKAVRASGIPDTSPLYYTGTLTENGVLINGTRDLTVNLWSAPTGGTMLCQTLAAGATPAQVTNGRFRIALDASCKAAINQNNNASVEVFDGTTNLGRVPIGAVPYAVEADHAASASSASNAPVVTDWQSYTPVVSNMLAAQHTTTGQWRRVGDSVEVRILTTLAQGFTSSGGWQWSLPPGLSADTAKLNAGGDSVGHGRYVFAPNATMGVGDIALSSSGTLVFQVGTGTWQFGAGQSYDQGDTFTLTAQVPISGWTFNK